jgi:phosphohistidine phosphatase SixA
MRFSGFVLAIFAVTAAPLSCAGMNSDSSAVIDKMKAGGHILMIRHALAPGIGDPANFKIGECTTQRNLNDHCREQAQNIGKGLRAKGINTAKVYSSQWCRCLETAELLDMGTVAELPALNSFFDRPQDRGPSLKKLRAFIALQPADGPLIILVTHQVTISAIADENVSSGEGVLLKINENAPYEVAGRVNFD